MDPLRRPASPVKSTGLPRLSKLPTPQPSRITVAPQEVQLANTARPLARPTGNASKSFGLTSPVKSSTIRPPTTARRTSGILPPSSYSSRPATITAQRPISPVKTTAARQAPKPTPSLSTSRPRPKSVQIGPSGGLAGRVRQTFDARSPSPVSSPFLTDATPQPRKVSRPSLADRTKESLSTLPGTPASDRRRSGIFGNDSPPARSPTRQPPRPMSAMSVPKRGAAVMSITGRSLVRPPSPIKKPLPGPPSTRRTSTNLTAPMAGRRSMSAQLPSASNTARTMGSSIGTSRSAVQRGMSAVSPLKQKRPVSTYTTSTSSVSGASDRGFDEEEQEPLHSPLSPMSTSLQPVQESPKSSSTFQRQIQQVKAKAKADLAKGRSKPGMRFDEFADPFNQKPRDDGAHVLRQKINAALRQGKLNIANMDLDEIPDAVLTMYEGDSMVNADVMWNETVDLTTLIAAGNNISILDTAFPEVDPEDAVNDDSLKTSVFAGVERIDFRDNPLVALPAGLRFLRRLTSINLSRTQLGNGAFEILSQVPTIKELILTGCHISGFLPQTIAALSDLETLDVSYNKLLSVPEQIRELTKLRKLNLAQNQMTGLPMDALESLPLTNLDISSNALVGALFPFGVSGLKSLQELNVSNNSLASLAFSDSVTLPNIQILKLANNRVVNLPDMSGWSELVTLAAGGNKLSTIPPGFVSLRRIRLADFSSNDLTQLDPRIALMDSLESLVVSANPLVDRKFLTMSADGIKRDLRPRLEPAMSSQRTSGSFVDEGIDVKSPEDSPSPFRLTATGAMDLSNRSLDDDDADGLRSLLGMHDVRELLLAKNKLTCIPYELSLAQNLSSLDLSMCELGSAFVPDQLALPCLQDLQLSGNKITTLEPMMTNLHAPYLRHLDLSHNKLSGGLPVLRKSFPHLVELFAADNKLESISSDALKGFHTAILSRNNIMQLPAEIGLLWFEGLKGLDVSGNAFRVPNHTVLQKGTGAVMGWLRNRIPGYVDDDETF